MIQNSIVTDVVSNLEEMTLKFNSIEVSRKEFNFFSAIVTGKQSKEHLEFYHSNFIASLLSQTSNKHAKLFLQELLIVINEMPLINGIEKYLPTKIEGNYLVEREKVVNGYIDIFIESKGEWVFFIENKINSQEGKNQVSDYCEWFNENRKCIPWFGIYLTKEGSEPEYSKGDDLVKNRVICLGYRRILQWLETCLKKNEVGGDHNINFSLTQYISILKKILNMDLKFELNEYLKNNRESLSNIVGKFSDLKTVIENFIILERALFLYELGQELRETLLTNQSYKLDDVVTTLDYVKINHNYEIIGSFDKIKCRLKIAQSYPAEEDRGRGLWWGIYPPERNRNFHNIIKLKNGFWQGIEFTYNSYVLDDFEKDTDHISAIIVSHNTDNLALRKLFINQAVSQILECFKIQVSNLANN